MVNDRQTSDKRGAAGSERRRAERGTRRGSAGERTAGDAAQEAICRLADRCPCLANENEQLVVVMNAFEIKSRV